MSDPGEANANIDAENDSMRAENEQLKGLLSASEGLRAGHLNAINRLRSALQAQEDADFANEFGSATSYENWQALQDKAVELRREMLGSHQQSGSSK